MNIQDDKPRMIFAKEHDGRKYYKVGISKKLANGEYENGYIDIQFRQGVEFENKTRIYLRNAFLTFYKSKDKATIPYIFVMDYEVAEEQIKHNKETDVAKQETKDDFADFGREVAMSEVEITDSDLPF